MRPTVIIPARFASSRFPGKPLANIAGKLLVRRVWEIALEADVGEVWVATDDARIFETVREWDGTPGLHVMHTSDRHRNGTERCAEVAERLELSATDVVINLQGDSPLVPPDWLHVMRHAFTKPDLHVATFASREGNRYMPGTVCAVSDSSAEALLFTRPAGIHIPKSWLRHFGVYGYRAGDLRRYAAQIPWYGEAAEQLEQLRFLEHRLAPIKLLMAPEGRLPIHEVNYPADVPMVEEELRKWGIN